MKVIRAEVLGMCFGVRDALQRIQEVVEPEVVTIHGQLVHNEAVLDRLRERGFCQATEKNRQHVPETPEVLITAHGISDAERRRLEAAGKRLIDTTCPLVLRVHKAAQDLQKQGYHVLVIGRKGHVEVEGIVGDLNAFNILESLEDVQTYSHSRLGIVCQTTQTDRHVRRIHQEVLNRNPEAEVRLVNTVCQPTRDHQRALERLLGQVDAMVVVGGRNSNNTKELAALCRERGVPALHVQGPTDLDPAWLANHETIGLTAGTSTLDETIDAIQEALLVFAHNEQRAEVCLP